MRWGAGRQRRGRRGGEEDDRALRGDIRSRVEVVPIERWKWESASTESKSEGAKGTGVRGEKIKLRISSSRE